MNHREGIYGKSNYSPIGSIKQLENYTYYLTKIDSQFRRFYAIKTPDNKVQPDGTLNPRIPKQNTTKLDSNYVATTKTEKRLQTLDNQFKK